MTQDNPINPPVLCPDGRPCYGPGLRAAIRSSTLRGQVDLRPWCSPIEHQGRISSCTGHALTAAMEYLENKLSIFDGANNEFLHISRLFTYYNERVLSNTVSMDKGGHISNGIRALATYGACRESLWAYDPSLIHVKPSEEAYADAKTRLITAYSKVCLGSIFDVKRLIHSEFPIVFGMQTFQSFEGAEVARTGVVNIPVNGERFCGGHAVLMVGYDDASERVLVRNSWGDVWGMGGYFTLPYSYVTNARLSSDAWVIHN